MTKDSWEEKRGKVFILIKEKGRTYFYILHSSLQIKK